MGFGGSVASMITQMRNNRNLAARHKERWNDRRRGKKQTPTPGKQPPRPQLSAAELAALQAKIQRDMRLLKQKQGIMVLVVGGACLGFLIWLFSNLIGI